MTKSEARMNIVKAIHLLATAREVLTAPHISVLSEIEPKLFEVADDLVTARDIQEITYPVYRPIYALSDEEYQSVHEWFGQNNSTLPTLLRQGIQNLLNGEMHRRLDKNA